MTWLGGGLGIGLGSGSKSRGKVKREAAGPVPSAPVLAARGLSRSFRVGESEVLALRDADLEVEAGDFVAVVGPSGSGKSTLLHLLGLIDSPSRGEVRLQGEATGRLGGEARARRRLSTLGFIFQTFNLLQSLTTRQNVEVVLQLAGVPKAERRRRAEALLQAVGLGERLDHRPVQLSGGERQRVAIARAMANRPAVLLADEPTGNLDSKTGDEVVSLLEDLNAGGQTVVMVTHNAAVARRAKRVFAMQDGELREVSGEGL